MIPLRPITDGASAEHSAQDWLPNFLAPRALLLLACLAQLIVLAVLLLPARNPQDFWMKLGATSLLAQWIALNVACALSLTHKRLMHFPPSVAGGLSVLMVAAVSFISVKLVQLSQQIILQSPSSAAETAIDTAHALRIAFISALVCAAALRYSFVQSQWQQQIQAHQKAKIQALTARIRPHFLFNSMNSLASLIAHDPGRAERAVEDLSELFRAALRSAEQFIPLREELALARHYLDLEQLRLDQRLQLDIRLDAAEAYLDSLKVPPLILQPLVENAIYHGIAARAEGGLLRLEVRINQKLGRRHLVIEVENPKPSAADTRSSFDSFSAVPLPRDSPFPARAGDSVPDKGHGMALQNIEARLLLAFGEAAQLQMRDQPNRYLASLWIPI